MVITKHDPPYDCVHICLGVRTSPDGNAKYNGTWHPLQHSIGPNGPWHWTYGHLSTGWNEKCCIDYTGSGHMLTHSTKLHVF